MASSWRAIATATLLAAVLLGALGWPGAAASQGGSSAPGARAGSRTGADRPPSGALLAAPLPVPGALPGPADAAAAPGEAVEVCGDGLCYRSGGWVYRMPRPPAHRAPTPGGADARAAAILRAQAGRRALLPGVRLLPAAREPGLHVVISKRLNRLFLLDGGLVVAAFPVGTGRSSQLTPEGRFQVVIKGVNPDWRSPSGEIVPGGTPQNPLGARWIGFTVTPGDWGLKFGIHGTNDPASIGGYVSSGCVRMRNEHVAWLYERVEVGTWVYIE